MNPTFYSENDFRLYHHGILGMKWGVRRYQNKDGSLTAAGKKRRGIVDSIRVSVDRRKRLNESAKKEIKKYKKQRTIENKIRDNALGKYYDHKAVNSNPSMYRSIEYQKNLRRLGEKNANKIEYLIDERGLSRNAATKMVKNEIRNQRLGRTAAAVALLAIKSGAFRYARMVGSQHVMANNILMNRYSDFAGGLNTVDGGRAGLSTTLKALQVGRRVMKHYGV